MDVRSLPKIKVLLTRVDSGLINTRSWLVPGLEAFESIAENCTGLHVMILMFRCLATSDLIRVYDYSGWIPRASQSILWDSFAVVGAMCSSWSSVEKSQRLVGLPCIWYAGWGNGAAYFSGPEWRIRNSPEWLFIHHVVDPFRSRQVLSPSKMSPLVL